MPPKSKSIFRQPGARHFQVVHRSQRDPLIHESEASQHVLKEVERVNQKGKTKSDLEELLGSELQGERANTGEASLYGVYYDDTDYDYMQHLRAAGLQEEGVESILIEASSSSKTKDKAKTPITLKELPAESLPSTSELPRDYESQQAIPSSIAGFQPDLNPHLRQVIEALEDDAFVDDGLEDDFFGDLIRDGELEQGDSLDYEFHEDGLEELLEGEDGNSDDEQEHDQSFEARFARFKKDQRSGKDAGPGTDVDVSESGDTIGALPQLSVIGGKRRRKGASDATGYSMSSSSMTRNDALMTLDQRFDQIMTREYGSDEEEEEGDVLSEASDEAPELITTREDFEALMDDFLNNHEVVGRKLKPVLPGNTAMDKLETYRRAIGVDERVKIDQSDSASDEEILMPFDPEDKKDQWDCETILSTYSNLENHPRLIRIRNSSNVKRIEIDPRAGIPILQNGSIINSQRQPINVDIDQLDHPIKQTIKRAKDESKEDKKARKLAVKAERQARRVDKKVKREQFDLEFKQQTKTTAAQEHAKMRKL